jgi:hypothetical protein
MPSAPTTTSAVALRPSANDSVAPSAVCATPVQRAFTRTQSAGNACCSTL